MEPGGHFELKRRSWETKDTTVYRTEWQERSAKREKPGDLQRAHINDPADMHTHVKKTHKKQLPKDRKNYPQMKDSSLWASQWTRSNNCLYQLDVKSSEFEDIG